jgi:hypothetical protein
LGDGFGGVGDVFVAEGSQADDADYPCDSHPQHTRPLPNPFPVEPKLPNPIPHPHPPKNHKIPPQALPNLVHPRRLPSPRLHAFHQTFLILISNFRLNFVINLIKHQKSHDDRPAIIHLLTLQHHQELVETHRHRRCGFRIRNHKVPSAVGYAGDGVGGLS